MHFFNTKKQGIILIEVIVAVTIISIAFIALSGSAVRTLALSYQSLRTAEAGFLLEEGAEAMRTIRDTSWTAVTAASLETPYFLAFGSGAWWLTPSGIPIHGFTRAITLHQVSRSATSDIVSSGGTVDPNTVRVTVTVAWQNGSNTTTKSFSFYLTNIFN